MTVCQNAWKKICSALVFSLLVNCARTASSFFHNVLMLHFVIEHQKITDTCTWKQIKICTAKSCEGNKTQKSRSKHLCISLFPAKYKMNFNSCRHTQHISGTKKLAICKTLGKKHQTQSYFVQFQK
jgi:hypothetical protein